jgi:2,3-bisphosphoglycerate-independent phosphoglycerate mutase
VERTLALSGEYEFVLLHVESVDQTSPRGSTTPKVEAVNRLDADVLGPIVEGLRGAGGDWRLAVVGDVTSSSAGRCYTRDPVPFVVATPRDAGRASAPRRPIHGARGARAGHLSRRGPHAARAPAATGWNAISPWTPSG